MNYPCAQRAFGEQGALRAPRFSGMMRAMIDRAAPAPRLSCIMPAYNEAANLPRVVPEVLAALARLSPQVELILVNDATHPMNVVRAAEIRRWVDSGAYGEILAGTYPRREDDKDAKISDEAAAAAKSYADRFQESEDSLAKLGRDIGGGLSDLGKWVGGRLRSE